MYELERKRAKQEASIWAKGTSYTAAGLISLYDDYLTECEEAGEEYPLDFQEWSQKKCGIANKETLD